MPVLISAKDNSDAIDIWFDPYTIWNCFISDESMSTAA